MPANAFVRSVASGVQLHFSHFQRVSLQKFFQWWKLYIMLFCIYNMWCIVYMSGTLNIFFSSWEKWHILSTVSWHFIKTSAIFQESVNLMPCSAFYMFGQSKQMGHRAQVSHEAALESISKYWRAICDTTMGIFLNQFVSIYQIRNFLWFSELSHTHTGFVLKEKF